MKHLLFKFIIAIWKVLPFKKSFSGLIKKSNYLKTKLYQDLRYKGNMKVKVQDTSFQLHNPGFTTIENEIFWNGIENGWEKISLEIWQKLVMQSTTILDIGANTGVYSFVANAINPDVKIYAFEPVQRTSSIFLENLKINESSRINLIQKAVSNENGEATFYDLPTESQYSASLSSTMLEDNKNRIEYNVDVLTLDSFEELKGKKIDLIKLDVEMHEPEAIEGMINLLKTHEPSMLIEILTDEVGQKVDALLKDIDYKCFSIDEEKKPTFVPNIRQSEFHNLLLIKEDKIEEAGLSYLISVDNKG